ncbi:hypothetical protein Droror1_Dr00026542 [Drosera rotundifolia]
MEAFIISMSIEHTHTHSAIIHKKETQKCLFMLQHISSSPTSTTIHLQPSSPSHTSPFWDLPISADLSHFEYDTILVSCYYDIFILRSLFSSISFLFTIFQLLSY